LPDNRREPQAARHRSIGVVDLGIRDVETPPLGLPHLQLLGDELVNDILAYGRLVRRQLNELAALLDVERRDRLAVDDDDHLLGAGAVCRQRDPNCEQGDSQDLTECRGTVEHRYTVRFLRQ
jgi:hypothetical protein